MKSNYTDVISDSVINSITSSDTSIKIETFWKDPHPLFPCSFASLNLVTRERKSFNSAVLLCVLSRSCLSCYLWLQPMVVLSCIYNITSEYFLLDPEPLGGRYSILFCPIGFFPLDPGATFGVDWTWVEFMTSVKWSDPRDPQAFWPSIHGSFHLTTWHGEKFPFPSSPFLMKKYFIVFLQLRKCS